jgi:hypothetical protein
LANKAKIQKTLKRLNEIALEMGLWIEATTFPMTEKGLTYGQCNVASGWGAYSIEYSAALNPAACVAVIAHELGHAALNHEEENKLNEEQAWNWAEKTLKENDLYIPNRFYTLREDHLKALEL